MISLSLFLLLSSLFYFVFIRINFSNLYFWIIKVSVPLSKIMEGNAFFPLSLSLPPPPLEIFSNLFPLFKEGGQKKHVNETNIVKIYICIKFFMYKILFWQLKLVCTISIFAIKMIKNAFYCTKKKLLSSSRFSNFCTSLFLSFFLSWPLLIL